MTRLTLLTLSLWTLFGASARASVTVTVPEGAADLARELAFELGPDSVVVYEGEPSERPIDVRVAVQQDGERTAVEVRHRSLPDPLRSATSPDADPRTLAIVAAALIVEADERFLASLGATSSPRVTVPADRWTTVTPARATRSPDAPIDAAAPDDGAGLVLQLGLGGLVAVNRDHARAGGQARLVLGHRFDPRYRLAAVVELGGLSDPISSGPHLQPWGRACAEGAIGTPARPVAIMVAVHSCVVAGSRRTQGELSLRDAAGHDPDHGAYAEIGWASFSGGGSVAVGVSLDATLHLWIRVDVDGTIIGPEGYVVPALTLLLGTP